MQNSGIYKKNFISKVILKIDFLDALNLDNVFANGINRIIKDKFPNRAKDRIITWERGVINFRPGNESSIEANVSGQGIEKSFSDDSGSRLVISNKYFVLECLSYTSFTNMYSKIEKVISYLFEHENINTEQIGLRYTNTFRDSEIKIRKKFFRSEIATAVQPKSSIVSDDLVLNKSSHQLLFSIDKYKLIFQYGYATPELQLEKHGKTFVLDYYFYTNISEHDCISINQFVEKGHSSISKLFEWCITDDLREVLNA